MIEALDTKAAAAYCDMPLQTFKWWVWMQKDKDRRFTPDGTIGGVLYWFPETLDDYMKTRYRGPGNPLLTSRGEDDHG